MPYLGIGESVRDGRLLQVLGVLRNGIVGAVLTALAALSTPASALVVELTDVGADRVERQRAWARGEMPLPGTPDVATVDARLAAKGLAEGDAVFIRIFKAESELEVWMRKGNGFVLFETYPICHWTGTLGPKIREGDKQSPEGFYSITARQSRHRGRWRKAFNLGFPNALDQRLQRTGSYILLHGGCSSTGCFAMTDPVLDEIYGLAQAALAQGQQRVHVHIFPFRMTERAMAQHVGHPASDFWRDLKAGYDAFERALVPPTVGICNQRYVVRDGDPGTSGDPNGLAVYRAGSDGECRVLREQQAQQSALPRSVRAR
jgi:murein L,D-transpeptidase YafK